MNKGGYTLMEVSLFLAISGTLSLVAIVGLGPRLTNVRFSTTMRDLQSNITKQLTISARGDSQSLGHLTCTTSGSGLTISASSNSDQPCVYVGKVALLGESDGVGGQKVSFHTIVASLDPVSGAGCESGFEQSSLDYIRYCSQARLLGSNESTKSYSYSNQLVQDGSLRYGYGFVRTVDTDTVHRFVFKYSGDVSDKMLTDTSLTYVNTSVDVCYKMSNRRAVLELSQNYSAPKLFFNKGTC